MGFDVEKSRFIWLFVVAHFLVLGVSASCRHLSGLSAFYDLGVMDNFIWQTLHGRLFFYPQYGMSYFGDHFTPILFLFVPPYAIWPSPLVLILGQAMAFAIGGLFVHRIALLHLMRDQAAGVDHAWLPRSAGWAFTVIYALHPSLLHIALFDFHPIALMIPLALAAYYCYMTRRWFWLVVLLVLLSACQEEAAITVAAFGLYLLVFGRTPVARWIGATTSVTGALYFVLVMKVIIPAFQPSTTASWVYLSRYAHLGSSMGDIVRTLALHPLDALVRSFALYKLETLLWLLLPLGLLPLFGWRALMVALPSLGYTYLSSRLNQFDIRNQYFAPALGWLVIGAVQGFGVWLVLWTRHAAGRTSHWRRAAVVLPLAGALVATLEIDRRLEPIEPRYFAGYPYREDLDRLQRIIGPEASLSVTSRPAASFAHRREYFLALDFSLNRELNAALGLPDYRDTMFHLFDLTALEGSQDRERRVAQLLGDPRYGVRFYRFPLVLFERGLASGSPPELEALLATDGDGASGVVRVFPAVFLRARDATAVQRDLGVGGRGATMRFTPGRYGTVTGPSVILSAGSYAVDFYLKVEAPAIGPIADLEVVSSPADRRWSDRQLTAVDFTSVHRCQPFTLSFVLPGETADVEFRTRSRGAAFSLCKVVLRDASAEGAR